MGESTHWHQPELLGSVPSLAARELWNIFVRAGFLYSLLRTFSESDRETHTSVSIPVPYTERSYSFRESNEHSPPLPPAS